MRLASFTFDALFRLQNEVHIDGIVVGVAVVRVDHVRAMNHSYGLGLASVLAIVQLHGGKLSFHNAHPGLVARIWLPAVADV